MSDCLIVGGGIIGLLTARELCSAGASVTLVERGNTARESSWAGGGILSPLYPWRYPQAVTSLALWGQQRYPALAQSLKQESGVDPELVRSGLLILDRTEHQQALDWAAKSGGHLEVSDKREIAVLEPVLAEPPERALWMPEVAQIRNPRLTRALRRSLQSHIKIREQTRVAKLLVENDRVSGVRTHEGSLFADKVVVCAGAWSRDLLEPLGVVPSIEPVRGQMILFRATPGMISRIVLHQNRYVIPRRDGRVLVGSTLERVGFDKSTTQTARDDLYRAATKLFPALADAAIETHWAGLRPGAPAGIPYIGSYPDIAGLYFNAGHFRNGVVLAPASARLLTDLLTGKKPILPAAPYALEAERVESGTQEYST